MMISIYTGTPGSGKSYHAIVTVMDWLQRPGCGIISNFPVSADPSFNKVAEGVRLLYWDNSEITPSGLVAYARKYHSVGTESQTLLIVDEAQVVFNSRSFQSSDRMSWIKFFSQHRKLGYDVILVAQHDRMIDKQIRMLIEYEIKHRKINNYGAGGFLFTFFGRWSAFLCLRYWYGGNKLLLDRKILRFRQSVADLYDSYRMFSDHDLDDYSDSDLDVVSDRVVALHKSSRLVGIMRPFRRTTPSVGGNDEERVVDRKNMDE